MSCGGAIVLPMEYGFGGVEINSRGIDVAVVERYVVAGERCVSTGNDADFLANLDDGTDCAGFRFTCDSN